MENEKNKNDEGESNDGHLLLIGILIVIAVLFAITAFAPVNTGFVGLRFEFGRLTEVMQPGVHLVIPFVNTVSVMSVQNHLYTTDAAAASSNLQDVHTTVGVNYRVKNDEPSVKKVYSAFLGEVEPRLIAPMVQEVVKEATAKRTASELITKREDVRMEIFDKLKSKLDIYGLVVEEVSITNFNFSASFTQAIEAKVTVEQQKQQMQLEYEKKLIEVQKQVAEANASAVSQVLMAEAYAKSVELNATASANATRVMGEAQAEAIHKINQQISQAYINYAYAQKWNGQVPYVQGSSGLLINIGNMTG